MKITFFLFSSLQNVKNEVDHNKVNQRTKEGKFPNEGNLRECGDVEFCSGR